MRVKADFKCTLIHINTHWYGLKPKGLEVGDSSYAAPIDFSILC